MKDIQVILVTHRISEIPPLITHALVLENGRIIMQGKKDEVLNNYQGRRDASRLSRRIARGDNAALANLQSSIPDPLIKMKNITVCYGNKVVLDNLNWTVKRGEHWALVGPNGAGKTTLLRLITGDNPQAYSQEIHLFGKKKGSGETVWEIKQYISEVSGDMQIRFQKNIKVQEVVVSGFFESIGLFRQSSVEQLRSTDMWLENMGLKKLVDRSFTALSQGQQRMVLIARAMVKNPLLLLLDEVTDGMDVKNRKKVLELIQWIGTHTQTQIIFVTHHEEEIPKCVQNTLSL